MRRPVDIPDDPEIAVVETVEDLLTHNRAPHESMILTPRPIKGCFNDMAIWLMRQSPWHDQKIAGTNMYAAVRYRVCDLEAFALKSDMMWQDEMNIILTDMYRMEHAKGEASELRVVRENGYDPETYEFHQDPPGQNDHIARIREMGNIMCCYTDPTTVCLLRADAIPLPPVTGQQLPHFKPREGAKTFRPNVGDMWRQARLGQGAVAQVHKADEIIEENVKQPWDALRPWNPPRMLAVC